jgi:hypothetical protein
VPRRYDTRDLPKSAYKSQLAGTARGRTLRRTLAIALGVYLLLTATALARFETLPSS